MMDTIILITIGSIFLIAWSTMCCAKYNKWNNKRKKCKKNIDVCVSDILEKKTKRGRMVYKPIFVGKEGVREYIIDSAYYSNLVSFKHGEIISLLVNPDNYNEFLYADNRYNKGVIADVLSCLVPLIFLMAIVAAIIV